MASERNREPNSKLEDIEFLVECCAKKIGILENKKTDGKTLAAKNLTWAQIANKFKENPATLNPSKDQFFNHWKSLKT
uniref:Regulatory protein zeste n=1 Tax=Romanomermis culicivorax TaxID=13658 RepID=A0A915L5C6_ROMCU